MIPRLSLCMEVVGWEQVDVILCDNFMKLKNVKMEVAWLKCFLRFCVVHYHMLDSMVNEWNG